MPVVRAIEVYPTQNISFDEVLDLTADAFPFCNIGVYSCAPHQVYHARIYMHGTGISLTAVYLVHIYHAWCTFEYKRCHKSRRPRWLGRLSSCLARSISRVQLSPGAHTRRDFFLHKKTMSGKRESVSYQNSMKIDEQWECWTLCAIKMKARTGGKRDDTCDHGLSRRSPRVKPPTSWAGK